MPVFRKLPISLAILCTVSVTAFAEDQARLGVTTIANSPHLLIRQVSKPTRAALTYAAFTNNPALQPLTPDAASLAALGEASLKKVADAKAVDKLPADLDGRPFEDPLDMTALFNYFKANELEYSEDLPKFLASVLKETWGGTKPASSSQRVSDLILVLEKPGGPVHAAWAKISFEPWAKVDSTITDNDGDGRAEYYLPLQKDILTDETYEEITGPYLTEVLEGADIDEFYEMVLGELYNKIYATLKARGSVSVLNAASVEPAEVKAELGTLEIKAPDVVVTAKPHGQWIYNVFLIGDKPGAVTGTPGAPVASAPVATQAMPIPPIGGMPAIADPVQNVSLADFRADLAIRLTALGPHRVLRSAGNWLLLDRSLQLLAAPTLDGQKPDPLAVITDLSKKLEAKGITLVFVPVPSKETIYPEKIGGRLPDSRPNAVVGEFLGKLTAAGVKTVDLQPVFAQMKGRELLYHEQDTHWTPHGLMVAAQALADKAAEIVKVPDSGSYPNKEISGSFKADLVAMLPEADQLAMPATEFKALQVQAESGGPLPPGDASSPYLLMGDSYTVIFERQHAQSAGLASHLSGFLGAPVELLAQQGGGPDVVRELAQRHAADPNYLAQKKVIFWVMTERDLLNYQGKWLKIPLK